MADELLEMLASLSVPENYDAVDRFHDFQAVFLDTDQGRRVLKQIMSWGHLLRSMSRRKPIDVNDILISEGERNMALRIFAVMLVEPPRRETTQVLSDKED